MKTLPLTQTNPYFKDSELREKLNQRSVRSSCGVEGIKAPTKTAITKIVRREKKLFKKLLAKLSSD